MPNYDFRCSECQLLFEITRAPGSADPVHCPACGAEAKRVFTPVGVVFKGSGFHNTDYKPRPSESAPSSSGEAPSCPSAGSSSGCASCPSAN